MVYQHYHPVQAVCEAAMGVEVSAEIILFHHLTFLITCVVDILLLKT